jgi:hypothetical protein
MLASIIHEKEWIGAPYLIFVSVTLDSNYYLWNGGIKQGCLYRVSLELRWWVFAYSSRWSTSFCFNTRFLTSRSKSSFTTISVLKSASVSGITASLYPWPLIICRWDWWWLEFVWTFVPGWTRRVRMKQEKSCSKYYTDGKHVYDLPYQESPTTGLLA